MDKYIFDVAVIGGGPAGLAAALAARNEGASVIILERDTYLGGILGQCIHMGFGLIYFDEELSGPEYADRFIRKLDNAGIKVSLGTTVLRINQNPLEIVSVCPDKGNCLIETKAIVLAMGCRERTRFAISLPGTRPAGIFTAGTAQRYLNIQNYLVGNHVVILGSGDIGMIMARRLTLEGAKVEAVVEIMPFLTGLTRNRVQCLDDYDIPLYLGHTITNISGQERIQSVTIAKVDERFLQIPESKWKVECDTLLLSIGLIPENELSKACGVKLDPMTGGPIVDSSLQTNVPGIFAAGNVLHVNDLVDNVSSESERAGKAAARFAKNTAVDKAPVTPIEAGENVRYVIPQFLNSIEEETLDVYFRVLEPKLSVTVEAVVGDKILTSYQKVKVNPGEMEKIRLNIYQIDKKKMKSIKIRVVDKKEAR